MIIKPDNSRYNLCTNSNVELEGGGNGVVGSSSSSTATPQCVLDIKEKIRNGEIDAAITALNSIGATGIVRTDNKVDGKLVSTTVQFTYQGVYYEETYTVSNDEDDTNVNSGNTGGSGGSGDDNNSYMPDIIFKDLDRNSLPNYDGTTECPDGVHVKAKALELLRDLQNILEPCIMEVIGWEFQLDYEDSYENIAQDFIIHESSDSFATKDGKIINNKKLYDAFLPVLQEKMINLAGVYVNIDRYDLFDGYNESYSNTGDKNEEDDRIKHIRYESKNLLLKVADALKSNVLNIIGWNFEPYYHSFFGIVVDNFVNDYDFKFTSRPAGDSETTLYFSKREFYDAFLEKLQEESVAHEKVGGLPPTDNNSVDNPGDGDNSVDGDSGDGDEPGDEPGNPFRGGWTFDRTEVLHAGTAVANDINLVDNTPKSVWELMDLKDISGYKNNEKVTKEIKNKALKENYLASLKKSAKELLSGYEEIFKNVNSQYADLYDTTLETYLEEYNFGPYYNQRTGVYYFEFKTKDFVDGFLTKLDEAIQAKKQ